MHGSVPNYRYVSIPKHALRTEGSGDYIVPVADQILGQRAAYLRTAQQSWKSELREKVRRNGMNSVITLLEALGSDETVRVTLKKGVSNHG